MVSLQNVVALFFKKRLPISGLSEAQPPSILLNIALPTPQSRGAWGKAQPAFISLQGSLLGKRSPAFRGNEKGSRVHIIHQFVAVSTEAYRPALRAFPCHSPQECYEVSMPRFTDQDEAQRS